MKIKASISLKINVLVILSLAILGLATIAISSYTMFKRGTEEVAAYRVSIMDEKKNLLKYLITTAYHIAISNYDESQDTAILKKHYGEILESAVNEAFIVLEAAYENEALGSMDARKEFAKKTIEKMPYGTDGKGYFWLNDLPPNLVMHPHSSPRMQVRICPITIWEA